MTDSGTVMDDQELEISEESVVNERKHKQLIDTISALDGSKSNKLSQRSVISNQISEFNFTSSKDKQGKVKLQELVGTLQDKALHKSLGKQINQVQSKNHLVSVPAPKHEREKIQRTVAFEKTSKEVSKWVPVVNQNRLADQLVFPLDKPEVKILTNNQIVQTFKPRTPLELEVAALLGQSDHVLANKDDELTPAERKALAAMDVEEAKERRKELMKHRALLSYQQVKAKRQNKIKSKMYHRKMKKGKRIQEEKVLSEMAKNDPEGFAEKMKSLEKQRVVERMNLKHRGGSKFAKRQKIFAKYDVKAREQVQNMLQLSRELTKKQEVELEEDSEGGVSLDSDDEAKMVESEATLKLDHNPWMAKQKLKVKKSLQNDSKPEPVEIRNENLVDIESDNEDMDSENNDNESQNDHTNETKDLDGDIDDIFKDFVPKGQKNNKKTKGKKTKQKLNTKEKEDENVQAVNIDKESDKTNSVKKTKRSKKKAMNKKKANTTTENVDSDEDSDESGIDESLSWKRTLEDFGGDSDTEVSPPKKKKKTKKNAGKGKGVKAETSGKKKVEEAYVDPKMLMMVESKIHHTGEGLDVVEEDSNVDSDEDNQREMIAEAFADDDVVEDFIAEKEDDIEMKTVKDVDLTLPGWGDWGGTNVKPSRKKRKIIKAPKQENRKDRNIGHVIINEDKLKDVAKHQVNSLPYPFNNADQFESSIRNPIGGTWNTPSAVAELVKPKILTKMGSVIAPIDKSEAFKNEKDMDNSTGPHKKDKSKKGGKQRPRKRKHQKEGK